MGMSWRNSMLVKSSFAYLLPAKYSDSLHILVRDLAILFLSKARTIRYEHIYNRICQAYQLLIRRLDLLAERGYDLLIRVGSSVAIS